MVGRGPRKGVMPKRPNAIGVSNRPDVLSLEGEIDLHVSPRVAISLRQMIAKKPKQLFVDLSRVTYLDSSGLAVLIEAMQNVEQYGGSFAIVGVQEAVR